LVAKALVARPAMAMNANTRVSFILSPGVIEILFITLKVTGRCYPAANLRCKPASGIFFGYKKIVAWMQHS